MLRVQNVSKRYGSVQALRGVSLDLAPGEVHAVLGENGAGKSTLVGILGGFVTPDSGSAQLNGESLPFGKPASCRAAGIEMVHQHFMLVPEFTVGENLALSRLGRLTGKLNLGEMIRPALEWAESLNWDVDPNAKCHDLPVGAQQRIEILKALAGDAPVILFDEPTAVLSPAEVADLVRVLRDLAARGKIVVLIAHKLAEVLAVADRVTVLRQGAKVAEAPIGEVNADLLATWMVGELPQLQAPGSNTSASPGLSLKDLSVNGDRGERAIQNLDLEIQCGQITGIGGVDGNGQLELAEALAGVRPRVGELRWKGKTFDAAKPRIAYIPQDRQRDGLALRMSISDNMLIAAADRPDLYRMGLLSPSRIRAWSEELVREYDIKVGDVRDPVGTLSGGNQQKVVVSRMFEPLPDVIIAMNPTRGLDIQASRQLHQRLIDAANQGAAVLLISTDLDELAALAHTTRFLSRGRLVEGMDAQAVVGGA